MIKSLAWTCLIGCLIFQTGCNKKQGAAADDQAARTDSSAAAPAGAGYHVVSEVGQYSATAFVLDPQGKKNKIVETATGFTIDSSASIIRVRVSCGGSCSTTYFVSKADGKVSPSYQDVIAFDPVSHVFARVDSNRIELRRLEQAPSEGLFLHRDFSASSSPVSALDSIKLEGDRFSYCYLTGSEFKSICDTVRFSAAPSAPSYTCASDVGPGQGCPAITLDFDGDGIPDSVQLISLTAPLGFSPGKIIEDPWGTDPFSASEKLAMRVKLTGQSGKEYILHDKSYLSNPDWDSPSTRMKNLEVEPKSDEPYPDQNESGSEKSEGPKGERIGLPTQAGPTIHLYYDGKNFFVYWPEEEGD